MNFASEDLSKELHKLSNWEGDDFMVENGTLVSVSYSMGYLLRKLPNMLAEDNEGTFVVTTSQSLGTPFDLAHCEDDQWIADYQGYIYRLADTPEDAACKLAIELFKQGVLNKKEDSDANTN